jgi:hypothetical protein
VEAVQPKRTAQAARSLLESAAVYAVFCSLGLASRAVPSMFVLFVAYGIAFPLLWAGLRKEWVGIGFTRRNLAAAIAWGVAGGILWGAYTYVAFGQQAERPPLLGLQIAIGLPIWLLIMSPFQEFFFRGWLQGRLRETVGRGWALSLSSVAFTAWHFFPDFEATPTATLPLSSPLGIISTLSAGLLFGYLYDRSHNIVAPWLAHALAGVALVLLGRMTFVQYVP